MNSVLQSILRRFATPTFQTSFVLILVAEAVTISLAWGLLNANVSKWINDKTTQAERIGEAAAASRDWSLIGSVPKDKGSQLFASYRKSLEKISRHYFPSDEGDVFLAVIDHGEEYIIGYGDEPMDPMSNNRKADKWELAAYSSGKTTRTPTPQTDFQGTWLAAYTPIVRNGKVVGILGAEYDSAPVADLQGVVHRAFLFSILPAILVSLVIAFVLASMFVQPTDVLRQIEETAQDQRARTPDEEKNNPWNQLTPKQKEIAELLRQGRESYKDLAEALGVEQSTIAQHFKDIKARTGWSKQRVAVEAAARRSAALASTA